MEAFGWCWQNDVSVTGCKLSDRLNKVQCMVERQTEDLLNKDVIFIHFLLHVLTHIIWCHDISYVHIPATSRRHFPSFQVQGHSSYPDLVFTFLDERFKLSEH